MEITMLVSWYDRKPDFQPDYDKVHYGRIKGKTPEECMKKYRELSWNHDVVTYTKTEIIGIY